MNEPILFESITRLSLFNLSCAQVEYMPNCFSACKSESEGREKRGGKKKDRK